MAEQYAWAAANDGPEAPRPEDDGAGDAGSPGQGGRAPRAVPQEYREVQRRATIKASIIAKEATSGVPQKMADVTEHTLDIMPIDYKDKVRMLEDGHVQGPVTVTVEDTVGLLACVTKCVTV